MFYVVILGTDISDDLTRCGNQVKVNDAFRCDVIPLIFTNLTQTKFEVQMIMENVGRRNYCLT